MSTKSKSRAVLKIKSVKKKKVRAAPRKAKSSTGKLKLTRVRVPVAMSTVQRGSVYVGHSSAPYHETAGSGLRLEIRTPICSIVRYPNNYAGQIFSTTFGTTSPQTVGCVGSIVPAMVVQPPYSTTENGWTSVFGSPLKPYGYFISMHRMFAFRSLQLTYEPNVSTNEYGSVALAVMRRTTSYWKEMYTYDDVTAIPTSVAGPFWKEMNLNGFKDKDLSKPASVLYSNTTGLPGVANALSDDEALQFRIVGATNALVTSGDSLILGTLMGHMIVDCYDMQAPIRIYYRAPTYSTMLMKMKDVSEEMKMAKVQSQFSSVSVSTSSSSDSSNASSTVSLASSSSSDVGLSVATKADFGLLRPNARKP